MFLYQVVQVRNKRATAIGAYDGFPANSFVKNFSFTMDQLDKKRSLCTSFASYIPVEVGYELLSAGFVAVLAFVRPQALQVQVPPPLLSFCCLCFHCITIIAFCSPILCGRNQSLMMVLHASVPALL
jgi:hypothetical protein